jgi:hypothetical protein
MKQADTITVCCSCKEEIETVAEKKSLDTNWNIKKGMQEVHKATEENN